MLARKWNGKPTPKAPEKEFFTVEHISKGDRVRYLFQIQHGMRLIDETVREWGNRLAKRVRDNPLDHEAIYWMKVVEQVMGFVDMDRMHDFVTKVVNDEVNRHENREELLERLFNEAQKRGQQTWQRTR